MQPRTIVGRCYACLIGTNEYEEDPIAFPPTSYPEANVDALADLFEDTHIGDFHRVVRLKDHTHTHIIRDMKRLSEQLKPDDLLLIYYAGYAIVDDEETAKLYLAAKNTTTDDIPSSSLELERIQTFLAKCPAHQKILILDCHYLNSPEAVIEHIARHQVGTCLISNHPACPGWTGLTAEERHSSLTKYLIEGLATGRADLEREGSVTIEAWFTYAQNHLMDHGLPESLKWDAGGMGTWVIARTVGGVDEAAETLPASLRRQFKDLSDMFREGLVIPFLGSGVIPPELVAARDDAEPKPFTVAPVERELSDTLAELTASFTDALERGHDYPLTVLAQYCQIHMAGGRPQFYLELKRRFPQHVRPGPVHRFLVQQEKPLLVVTTCYDTVLETMFREQGKRYAVVAHIAYAENGEDYGKVVVQYSDRFEAEIVSSDTLSIDLEHWWVFYKMQGTFDLFLQELGTREEIDSIVIAEEDYFSLLSRSRDQHRSIPNLFNRPFQRRMFLFLGYPITDWNFRALVHVLWQGERMRQRAGYAVRQNTSEIEKQFWESKKIQIIDMNVDDVVSRLAEALSIRI